MIISSLSEYIIKLIRYAHRIYSRHCVQPVSRPIVSIFDHPRSGVDAWCIISVVSVCLSVGR